MALPKPKTGNASTKGSRSQPSTGTRERGSDQGSSSAPPIGSRSRTTKAQSLQDQLARMYMMIGTMLMPFGRFYPVMAPIGHNLRELSNEASEAWMDLAQKDKRVMEMLESITGASTWGNVIGIHLAIFASALPGAGYISQVTESPEFEDEFVRQGRAMHMSDEEIALARAEMHRQQMPARDTSTGGPGDTVAAQPAPQYSEGAATATAAPPVSQSQPGIVSPEQLGVTQTGEDGTFPHDASPPNGTGVIE